MEAPSALQAAAGSLAGSSMSSAPFESRGELDRAERTDLDGGETQEDPAGGAADAGGEQDSDVARLTQPTRDRRNSPVRLEPEPAQLRSPSHRGDAGAAHECASDADVTSDRAREEDREHAGGDAVQRVVGERRPSQLLGFHHGDRSRRAHRWPGRRGAPCVWARR